MVNQYPPYPKKKADFDLLGVLLHDVDVAGVHDFMDRVITQKAKALILNVNIYAINLALQKPWFRDILNAAQLVFCDGDGVRWGIQLLGLKPPPKITYDRWFWQLGQFCTDRRYSLYFLGSAAGVAEEAALRMKEKFPALEIKGCGHGFFKKEGEENERVIAVINECKPDILVVGFGMPIQEKWLHENWQRMNAHIFLAGGAVFECISGRLDSPPDWILKMQQEWFYRFLQQPKYRFKRYFIGIPYFFFHVLREKFFGKKFRKA